MANVGGKRPGAGRPKGAKDKRHELKYLAARACALYKIDPFEIAAKVAAGDLVCTACLGVGKTKYQPRRGDMKLEERTCESCYGSGKEKIPPVLRLAAAKELMEYMAPKLKAIEHSGPDGGSVRASIEVRFVDAVEMVELLATPAMIMPQNKRNELRAVQFVDAADSIP